MFYTVIIISVFLYIISDILFAHQSRNDDVLSTYFFRVVLLVLFQIPLLYFADFALLDREIIFLSGIFGIFGIVYFLSSLSAYRFLPAGIVSFFIGLEAIVVIVLSYLVYNETLSLLGFFGAVLLLGAGFGLIAKKSEFFHLDKRWILGILFGLGALFGGAFWGFGFAYITRETDIFLGAFLSQFSILILFFFFGVFSKIIFHKKIIKFPKKIHFHQYILATFLYGGANWMYLFATTIGSINIAILFLSFTSIGVSLVSHFIFEEKLKFFQWGCIILGTIGLILINL